MSGVFRLGPRAAGILSVQPAAGADLALPLPAGSRLGSVVATLVTSAVAGDRYVSFRVLGSTGAVLWRADSSLAVAASSTQVYVAYAGAYGYWVAVGSNQQGPLPLIALPKGAQLVTVTAGIQAGDQWSITAAAVEAA